MGEPLHGSPVPPTTDRGYEHSDVAIRPLAMFIAGLAISLIIVSGIVAMLFWLFESGAAETDPAPLPLAQENTVTPGPLLQVSPRQDLELLRERDERLLGTAEWIDRDRGIARIPIERAMERIAEHGLPEWPAVEVAPASQAEDADRAPLEPAARTPQGSGQPTPIEGGRDP
jgi:hypothetical protein